MRPARCNRQRVTNQRIQSAIRPMCEALERRSLLSTATLTLGRGLSAQTIALTTYGVGVSGTGASTLSFSTEGDTAVAQLAKATAAGDVISKGVLTVDGADGAPHSTWTLHNVRITSDVPAESNSSYQFGGTFSSFEFSGRDSYGSATASGDLVSHTSSGSDSLPFTAVPSSIGTYLTLGSSTAGPTIRIDIDSFGVGNSGSVTAVSDVGINLPSGASTAAWIRRATSGQLGAFTITQVQSDNGHTFQFNKIVLGNASVLSSSFTGSEGAYGADSIVLHYGDISMTTGKPLPTTASWSVNSNSGKGPSTFSNDLTGAEEFVLDVTGVGSIALSSVDWSVFASSGQQSDLGSINLHAVTSSASPWLFETAADRSTTSGTVLSRYSIGNGSRVLQQQWNLTNVRVASYSQRADPSGATSDTFALTFSRVSQQQYSSGVLSSTTIYDLANHRGSGAIDLAGSKQPPTGQYYANYTTQTDSYLPLNSFGWGAAQPVSISSSGLGVGPQSLGRFSISVSDDSQANSFLYALTNKSVLSKVTLYGRRGTGSTDPLSLKYVLTNVQVVSYTESTIGSTSFYFFGLTFSTVQRIYMPTANPTAPQTSSYSVSLPSGDQLGGTFPLSLTDRLDPKAAFLTASGPRGTLTAEGSVPIQGILIGASGGGGSPAGEQIVSLTLPSFENAQVFLDALASQSSWDSLAVTLPFQGTSPRAVNVEYDLKNAYVAEFDENGVNAAPSIRLVCEQIDLRYIPAEGAKELDSSWNFVTNQGAGGADFGAETVPSDAQYRIDFVPATDGGEVQADNLSVHIVRAGGSSINFTYDVGHGDSTVPAFFEALTSGTVLDEMTVNGKNGSLWKLSGVQLRFANLSFNPDVLNNFAFTAAHATYGVPVRDEQGNITGYQTFDWDTEKDTGTGETDFDADVPPQIVGFNFIRGGPGKLAVQFSEDVSQSLQPTDVSVVNADDPNAGTFSPTAIESYDAATNTAVFDFSGPLANANYRASVYSYNVQDVGAQDLTIGKSYDFFMLAGDGTLDRRVSIEDFNILASNFGKSGKSFTQGNYDGSTDGKVTIVDFNILAANFGKTLQPPTTQPLSISSFSDVTIDAQTPLLSEAKRGILPDQLLEDVALL
jgi:type VI protein secretion system component Hcp